MRPKAEASRMASRKGEVMQEYQDGSFGELKEFESLIEDLKDPLELARTKCIHFGPVQELEAIREHKLIGHEAFHEALENRVGVIEKNINLIMIKLGIDDKTKILPVPK